MKILPVIVIYNSFISASESAAYNYLLKEYEKGAVDNIFIYDNSTEPRFLEQNRLTKFIYASCNGNKGLSYAYNRAAEYARDNGYDWLLLLDQDTIIPENLLSAYRKSVKENPDINLFMPKVVTTSGTPLSPALMRHYIPVKGFEIPDGIINPSGYSIINSGLLVNVDAFFLTGGYNEDVIVDFSDFQFIERFSSVFDKACVVDATCLQSFSNEDQSDVNKLNRFKIFCRSLRNYAPLKKSNRFWIHFVVLKRAVSLSLKTKTLYPYKILFQNYILR